MRAWDALTDEAKCVVLVVVLVAEAFLLWG
jgi:hypothetical protein